MRRRKNPLCPKCKRPFSKRKLKLYPKMFAWHVETCGFTSRDYRSYGPAKIKALVLQ